jgi:hypothetical protein
MPFPALFFGQKGSPAAQAPEPQNVSERRKVTRYEGEFFSDQRAPSTMTNAAAEELFLTKPSHSVLPLNPLKNRLLLQILRNGIRPCTAPYTEQYSDRFGDVLEVVGLGKFNSGESRNTTPENPGVGALTELSPPKR